MKNNCTRPWKPGYLTPIIGIAINYFLQAGHLMNPYSSQQDSNLCFGVLTPLIEESLVHNCYMAALLCQILQQHLINEVKDAIQEAL